MKKDLHDLLYTIWIDGKTAMIMRDEPEGTHHYELMHNHSLQNWVDEVAHKIRYAHTVHILGSGDVRNQLQQAIENNQELKNIVITNSSCRKLSPEQFSEIARENLVV